MRKLGGIAGGIVAAVALAGCGGGRPGEEAVPNPARRELREIVLLEAPGESSQPSFFEGPQPAVHDVLERIADARRDEHAVALFVRLGPMGGAWGRIDDLREALQAVRDAGKPVHCHFETIDNAGYSLAASACDRLTVTPAGMLDTVGVAAQVFYARSLLDQIGVAADLLQVGSFKGAAEPFTRQDMSPEMRESLGALLDDLQGGLVASIASGRRMTAERAQEVLDGGPYDSEGALAAGLVDAIEFDDEARTRAREAGSATRNVRVHLLPEHEDVTLADLLGALASGESPVQEVTEPHVVLAYLDGEITDAEERSSGSTGQAGPFVTRMRELAEDESVRAVVLRIDSPGGSALASDRMWHAVRRIAARKPVIVSVGDMAASGGYYVASAGDEIVAHPASIVGSIGVVGGKIDASALLARLGVHAETLTRGAHAGWSTPTAPFTDEERVVLRRMMESTYRRFVRRIAHAREMPEDRVLASAEGRIWSGREGLERGLVDRLGGLDAAMALARERAQLGEDAPVVEWPERRTMLESMLEGLSGGGGDDAARALVWAELGPAAGALRWMEALRDGQHVAVALPIGLEIR